MATKQQKIELNKGSMMLNKATMLIDNTDIDDPEIRRIVNVLDETEEELDSWIQNNPADDE